MGSEVGTCTDFAFSPTLQRDQSPLGQHLPYGQDRKPNSSIILLPALILTMQEVQYVKRMCEAIGYQVRRAARAGDHPDLARALGGFVSPDNRTSQIGFDSMCISRLFSAEEQLVGLPGEIHL
jgi:hypothetical protein